MTHKKDDMLNKKIGYRIKSLAKENGDTAQKLSEPLFCTKEQISRYYNGHCTISDDRISILAKRWRVREEYIRCEDDFKTNEELYFAVNENDIKNMQSAISYLESLDLHLKPYSSLHCSLTALKKNIDTLKPYIKQSSLDALMEKYDFSLASCEFHREYFFEDCLVELCKALPNHIFLQKDRISKNEHVAHATFIQVADDNNLLQQNYNVNLGFLVYYKNTFIKKITVSDLQEFVKQLDNYAKCTIETLLIKTSLH